MVGKYEIGVIITPDATEEQVKKVIESISTILKKAQATIVNVDEWGRKELAFPIQKNTEGYYVFIQTEGDGGVVEQVERRLRQTEKVIRFITLRLDDKLKKSNKLTKRWNKLEKIRKKTQETKEAGEERSREDAPEAEEEKNAE